MFIYFGMPTTSVNLIKKEAFFIKKFMQM